MTDWVKAGQLADAHRVRNLYADAFTESKSIARQRVIASMRAAGVTTVLDLWGGGVSARELVQAGFRVISVDDGSMALTDRGKSVSRARKRRALEVCAAEDGYEARFGKAADFAGEADGAYLDFCGPWTVNTRRAVVACRHMKAVAVTLTPDHDASTGATSVLERQMAYQMFLKMAWSEQPTWEAMRASGNVRRLLDYRRPRGFSVFLYLLAREWLRLPSLTAAERFKTRPDMAASRRTQQRAWYLRPENRDRIIAKASERKKLERRGPFDVVCVCGISFVSTKKNARYCSALCRHESKMRLQTERRLFLAQPPKPSTS